MFQIFVCNNDKGTRVQATSQAKKVSVLSTMTSNGRWTKKLANGSKKLVNKKTWLLTSKWRSIFSSLCKGTPWLSMILQTTLMTGPLNTSKITKAQIGIQLDLNHHPLKHPLFHGAQNLGPQKCKKVSKRMLILSLLLIKLLRFSMMTNTIFIFLLAW